MKSMVFMVIFGMLAASACTSKRAVKRYGENDIKWDSEGIYPVTYPNGKSGYIDHSGKLVIPVQFGDAGLFSEGLAPATMSALQDANLRDNKPRYGYIDKNGKFAITPQFLEARGFSEGFAAVRENDRPPDAPSDQWPGWKYIDPKGNALQTSAKLVIAHDFSEGLAAVMVDRGKSGYLDKTGKFAVTPQFQYTTTFSEGLAAVGVDRKTGYADKTGKLVINPLFDSGGPFSEGLAPVSVGDKPGFIDKTGKMVITLESGATIPRHEGGFSDGLALVWVGSKAGYIDKTGKMVIPAQFKWAQMFTDGLAAARMDESTPGGYIDKTGKFVIQGISGGLLECAPFFPDGIARVTFNRGLAYIDKTGKHIWDSPAK